ncbi:tyrosine-protein phosphatase non-receptor type 9-like [Cotesia glomerata]|uniref:protein-tyrosine-phosphatase n=1 Tax=Bracoviriform glomeratae TaxID=257816 RepID=Q6S4V0_9VIRU|nr:tyrosine-protein phosphatase non-receptor type 9-like [Cotesia glomerata]XP_044598072.1 tyrosine-protein phosphatase non-receptor type 9-like [Cotesia glomerata]AAR29979.1 protein tyrosine phosphatase [Bracoviriform glomeratae]
MHLNIISTPKFVPISLKEFKRRAQESDFLEAIQLEHYQIVAQSHFGSFEHFSKQENCSKNRYDDILCWDKTRVKITPKKEDTDYIHANYVDSFEIPKKYIATQGPLEETVDQFWQLIWEQNSRIIVMLTKLQDGWKENCAPYWHPYDDKYRIFQAGEISIRTVSETNGSGYVQTTFDVSNCITGESKLIKHYMYEDWPDNGVPATWKSFMRLYCDIKEERERLLAKIQDGPALGPIIVHCSAGVGRTGVFCAVDSCLNQLLTTKTISVPETVLKIRQQRYLSVLATEQYAFIYRILYEFVKLFETYLLQGISCA